MRDDLIQVLTGLAPGWYTSRDLLPRYNAWAADNGRESITAKTLGESVNRVLRLDRRNVHGNVRAFHVTPEALSGRDWFVEP